MYARFPQVREMQPSDNTEVLKLFGEQTMKIPGLHLLYDRSPSFQELLHHHSSQYKTLLCEMDGKLQGVCSFSWGPRWVHGEIKTVAYLSDFRSRKSYSFARFWRDFYPSLLETLQQQGIDYFLTAIMSDNLEAQISLVKKSKSYGFYYHLLAQPLMINVFAQKPWGKKNLHKSWSLSRASLQDQKELVEFLDCAQKKKIFGYSFSESEWNHRQNHWKGWSLSSFIIIRNQGQIIACCLPWSPTPVKRMQVQYLNSWLKIILRVGRSLKLNLPREQQPIETLYLTHLTFADSLAKVEQQQVVQKFINFISEENPQHNMISYPDFEKSSPSFESFFAQSTGISLYEVSLSPEPSYQFPQSVGFEMAMV